MATSLIQDPDISASQLLDRAQAELQRGNLNGATAILEKVLAQEQKHKSARIMLIKVLLSLGRLEEAERQANIFNQHFPAETEPVYLRAVVAFQRGQIPLARDLSDQCLARGDRRPEVYKLLALTEYLLQQYDKFETHIRAVLEQNSGDADAHYHLGRYFFEKKRYTEARNSFQNVIKIQSDHYKAHYYTGLVYEGENDGENAKHEFLAAIQIIDRIKVRYPWPFTDLGKRLVNEGEYERGLGWLYRGIRNDPASPYAHYGYAKALFQKGATFEVKQALLEAIRLDPGYSEAYYLLAKYYQKTGEELLAKETLSKFEELKKNPVPSPYGVRRW